MDAIDAPATLLNSDNAVIALLTFLLLVAFAAIAALWRRNNHLQDTIVALTKEGIAAQVTSNTILDAFKYRFERGGPTP